MSFTSWKETQEFGNYKTAAIWGVGGSEGIWSATRGEGTWSINVALLFQKLGIEVDIIGSGAGIRPEYRDKQCGMNFVDDWFNTDKQYDLFFAFSPIWKDNPELWERISKKVKKALFGTFWPSINDTRPTNDSILVSPYRTFGSYSMVLPYSYVDQFASPQFDNKTLVWCSKGPFNTSMGEKRFEVNLYHLRATEEAVNNGYHAIFLCSSGDFLYKDTNMPLQNESLYEEVEAILRRLREHPRAEFYDYLPRDQFEKQLKRGSVNVRCDGCGSFSDTLLFGIVPTVFTTWFWPVFFNKKYTELPELEDLFPDYLDVPEKTVRDHIFRLLEDKNFYRQRLEALRKNVPLYTTRGALLLLREILKIL